jgi:hypothetical protein
MRATIMTAPAYQRPMLDPHDALFRRCLTGTALAGVLFMIGVRLMPVITPKPVPLAVAPETRYARLVLPPQAAVPSHPVSVPVVTPVAGDPTHAPGGGGGGGGGDGLSKVARVIAPEHVAPGAGSAGPVHLNAAGGDGGSGRARAQAELGDLLGGAGSSSRSGRAVSSALDGLTASLGTASSAEGAAPVRAGGGRALRAARGEDALGGGGAGRVGGGSGADLGNSVVVGTLVALADLHPGRGGHSAGSGGGSGGGVGGGIGDGVGDGIGSGSGGGSGGGNGGGIGTGHGSGVGPGDGGGSGGVAPPGVYRSNASLLAVIQKYSAGIQYCYGNELKREPSLRGKLVISLVVAASGEVDEAHVVVNTLGSSRLADCALGQIREWRFPVIRGGATAFQAPFVFTPPQ